MYLNRLTNGEKIGFYSLASAVAAAHEGISLEEKALLEAALHEMKIPSAGKSFIRFRGH